MKQQEASRVRDWLTGNLPILDIGCGIGDFLADNFGEYDLYGVEPDEYAANEARSRGFIQVVGDISELDPRTFQAIIWRGTFQHLDEPMRVLKRCIELLADDGVLIFLATPNSNSLFYMLWGDLPALDAPRNYVIPSDTMLVNILKNLGMDAVSVRYPYMGTPYASPIKDFLRFLVGKKTAFPGSMMELYCRKISQQESTKWVAINDRG